MQELAAAKKFNILIVDDENVIADTLVVVFSKDGFDARAAYSAEHANSFAPEWVPDLAIIDGCLPNISGISLATQLKTACPACHIILFSGKTDTSDVSRISKQGGYNFVVHAKPSPPHALLDIAHALLFQT